MLQFLQSVEVDTQNFIAAITTLIICSGFGLWSLAWLIDSISNSFE